MFFFRKIHFSTITGEDDLTWKSGSTSAHHAGSLTYVWRADSIFYIFIKAEMEQFIFSILKVAAQCGGGISHLGFDTNLNNGEYPGLV